MPAGDLVIRDPRALRALAHPVRLAILERLQGEGPATATELGEVVGISPSAASYHLRSLARFGLVDDAGGGTGRNRPWRSVGHRIHVRAAPTMSARPRRQRCSCSRGNSSRAASRRRSRSSPRKGRSTPTGGPRATSRTRPCALTAAEAVELVRQIDVVVEPYRRSLSRRRPRGRAPGALPAPPLPPRHGGTGTVTRGRRTPLYGLLAANAISITGNRLTQLAIPWFVLQSTGSVAEDRARRLLLAAPVRDLLRARRRDRRPARLSPRQHRGRSRERRDRARASRSSTTRSGSRSPRCSRSSSRERCSTRPARRRARRCSPTCSSGPG